MLWPLLKIILFVVLIAAAAWGAELLIETDGEIQLSVAGMEYTLGPLEAVIALMAFLLAAWVWFKVLGLVFAFLRFVAGDRTSIDRFFDRRRERKGFDALAEGMIALASGESGAALSKASRAEKLLWRRELTSLLTAQAAEQAGDAVQAEAAYKRLLEDDRTRFVGIRGLMKQQLATGNTDIALKLAEKAFALRPAHVETQDVLLRLQAGAHDWTGARKTLGTKLRQGALPRDVHRRRDAVLALGEAQDILRDDRSVEAREKAIDANRLSPDLVPAAVMAADGYMARNKPKNALRILKKAWGAQPHPDLAAAFARLDPEESPEGRVKRFAALTGVQPDHPETRMLEAELQIAAENFPAARDAIGDLAEADPTARVLTIMAAIERGFGADDAVVKGWLARALAAPRDAQWVCENCHCVHARWAPVCERCESFDTLTWKRPSDGAAPLSTGAEMLPLIVGATDASDDSEAVQDDGSDVDQSESTHEEEASAPNATANEPAKTAEPPVDYVVEDAGQKDSADGVR